MDRLRFALPLSETGRHQRSLCRAAVLFVIALWVLLRPLASAKPPDPIWIAGMYDDGDFDDVVTFIGLLASASDMGNTPGVGVDLDVGPLAVLGVPAPVSASYLPPQDRSPPRG